MNMVFLKAANNIVINLEFITRNGIRALLEGMRTTRKFDPDNPFPNYNEKNRYFNPANNFCQFSLWNLGLYDMCARAYFNTYSSMSTSPSIMNLSSITAGSSG